MPITQPFLNANAAVRFKNGSDINNWFKAKKNQDFIDWFNGTQSGRGYWGKIQNHAQIIMSASDPGKARFIQFWNNLPIVFGTQEINLMQFLALQSILNNETGGRLTPLTEGVGYTGHPGIAYAFDRIPNLKRSYNTLAGNKTAFDLFNDADYIAAHGTLALNNQKQTTNQAWKGEVWPAGVPTSTDPKVTGFLLEADFFKFRGRGFTQTTGRSNYLKLIQWIQTYNGANPVVLQYKTKWAALAADKAATISTNVDWDNLFQNTNAEVACKAVNLHSQASKNYLNGFASFLVADQQTALYNMGLRISGGKNYALFFQSRVTQLVEGLA